VYSHIEYERDLQSAVAQHTQEHSEEYGDRDDADLHAELMEQVKKLSEHGIVDSGRDSAISSQESSPSVLEGVLRQRAADLKKHGMVDSARDEQLDSLESVQSDLEGVLKQRASDIADLGVVDNARDARGDALLLSGADGVCIADGACETVDSSCCSSATYYAAACPSTSTMCGGASFASKSKRKPKNKAAVAPPTLRQQLEKHVAAGGGVQSHAAPEDWSRLPALDGTLPPADRLASPMFFHLPASDWTSSFAVGNGRMGALLGWQPWADKIPITDDTLWTAYEHQDYKRKPNAGQAMQDYALADFRKTGGKSKYDVVKDVRELMWEGKVENAQRAASKLSAGMQQSFSFLGDLHVSLLSTGGDGRGGDTDEGTDRPFERYQRRLLMHDGTTQARFIATGAEGSEDEGARIAWHSREAFVSAPDQVMVMRYKCGAMPSDIDSNTQERRRRRRLGVASCMQALQLSFTRPSSKNKRVPNAVATLVQMGAKGASDQEPLQAMCLQNDAHQQGVDFSMCAVIVDAGEGTARNLGAHTGDMVGGSPAMGHERGPAGGTKATAEPRKGGAGLASRATLAENSGGLMVLVATATSFNAPNPLAQCEEKLLAAAGQSYEQLRTRHVEDFSSFAQRSFLQLHPQEGGAEGDSLLSAAAMAGKLTTDELLATVHRRNRLRAVSAETLVPSNQLWSTANAKRQGAKEFYIEEAKLEADTANTRRRLGSGGGSVAATKRQEDTALDTVASAAELVMMEQLYDWGRYLLISSSRQGTQPMNLQGIWGNALEAQWHGDYHMNINLQMNYWAAQQVNLREMASPLIDFVRELAVAGQTTASMYYNIGDVKVGPNEKGAVEAAGAPWVAHGFTDIWMGTPPYDEMQWALCPTCGAWVALSLWEEFEYGWSWRGDSGGESEEAGADGKSLASVCSAKGAPPSCAALQYVRDVAFPVLRGSAAFFLRYLRDGSSPPGLDAEFNNATDATASLFTLPATSPENSYSYVANEKDRGTGFLAAGPSFDTAVLSELFEAVTHAGSLLQRWGVCSPEMMKKYAFIDSESPVAKNCAGLREFLEQVANTAHRLPNHGKPQMSGPILSEYLQDSGLGVGGEDDTADSSRAQQLAKAFKRLPKSGADLTKTSKVLDPGHRHWSGVFPLYPGRQISPNRTPLLAEAAKKTIEMKLSDDGGHTGWSAAWLASLWCRLHDGSR
jgi:hypothetical protein